MVLLFEELNQWTDQMPIGLFDDVSHAGRRLGKREGSGKRKFQRGKKGRGGMKLGGAAPVEVLTNGNRKLTI
jgi:hypothetical protein